MTANFVYLQFFLVGEMPDIHPPRAYRLLYIIPLHTLSPVDTLIPLSLRHTLHFSGWFVGYAIASRCSLPGGNVSWMSTLQQRGTRTILSAHLGPRCSASIRTEVRVERSN